MTTDTWRRIEAALPIAAIGRWGVLANGQLHNGRTFAEYHEAWKARLEAPQTANTTIRQVGGERIRQPSSTEAPRDATAAFDKRWRRACPQDTEPDTTRVPDPSRRR